MAHVDARVGKWRGKTRMMWVASSLPLYVGTLSIQLLSADPYYSAASSRLNWHPRQFKWTRPFRWKTKSGFCACAITFGMCLYQTVGNVMFKETVADCTEQFGIGIHTKYIYCYNTIHTKYIYCCNTIDLWLYINNFTITLLNFK